MRDLLNVNHRVSGNGRLLSLFLFVLVLAACGGDSNTPTVVPTVTLAPDVIIPPAETVAAIQTESARELATAAARHAATALAGSTVNTCNLITQAEMESRLEIPLTGPSYGDAGMPLVCTFPTDEFEVHLFVASTADLAVYGLEDTSYVNREAAAANSEGYQPIDGVGDDAFAGIGTLAVLSGDYVILLDGAPVDQLIAIAELVISRLPR